MTGQNGKKAAAERALDFVESGMRLGLGTGSTAALFVEALGGRVRDGLDLVAVATSEATARQAAGLGIRLATLDEEPELDLVVDGADEIAPDLALIKGAGGALLREKMVATASRRMIVIADGSKPVDRLGTRYPVPIEVLPFGFETTRRRIAGLLRGSAGPGMQAELRRAADGTTFVTDGGHWILDLRTGPIDDPAGLGSALKGLLGVVEHGLFVGLADTALIGTAEGVIELRGGPDRSAGRG